MPWRLRRSCHPTQLASQLAAQLTAQLVATVYTNGQKRHREAVFANLCTLLRPHVLLARPSRYNSVHK